MGRQRETTNEKSNLRDCIISITKIKVQTVRVVDTVYSDQTYERNRDLLHQKEWKIIQKIKEELSAYITLDSVYRKLQSKIQLDRPSNGDTLQTT